MQCSDRPPFARLYLVGILLLVALPASVRAEGDEAAWKEANKAAPRLMKTPARLGSKAKVIAALAHDDSERATKMLVRWAVTSCKMRTGSLAKALDEAQVRYDKLVRILLKAYDTMPPNRKEDKDAYDIKKRALDLAKAQYEVEGVVHDRLAHAFKQIRDPAAVDFLLTKGERQVGKCKGSAPIVLGILTAYVNQPLEKVADRLLDLVRSKGFPEGRIRALNWIAATKVEGGFDATVDCLDAAEEAVRRSAVFTLRVLDDPRGVKPLIDALKSAEGLMAVEIENALHFYTGRSFDASHTVWAKWWEREGETWLAADDGERFETAPAERQAGGTTSFYGVETRSRRIVFVLDRSGSMQTPASDDARRASGPVTPGRPGEEEEPAIEGDTKIAVARNQLARSIKSLPKNVFFNVVFFSSDVQVWREPPGMVPATAANKKSALEWFTAIEAQGATRTFDALLRALDYAAGKNGADTVFLLSDGSPTAVGGGKALTGEEFDAEYKAFLEKNSIYKCVVHTIGVGPQHNRGLMRRIAKDTGGTYRGIGTR